VKLNYRGNCLALSLSLILCPGFVGAEETGSTAKDGASTLESQGPSRFHDQPIVVEGYLILPTEDAKDEYRVRMFDSESSFILKLSDELKEWASQCGQEPIKVEGTYKDGDGGIVEVGHVAHWYLDDVAWQMVCECNRYRQAHGLRPLQPLRGLLYTAHQHTWNMRHRYGFRHGGTSGWSGENIAAGQPNATSVTHTWYNSSGHRANMLNPNYSYIGVGYYNGMWTQQFR
jgi:hypothetical protein